MREFGFRWSGRDFDQGDVEIRINIDDFAFQLAAGGKQRVQRFFAAGEMGIGDNHAGASDEKS